MKLNLGCGKEIRKGWINVDKEDFGQDVVYYSVNNGKPLGLWFLPTFYWNQLAVFVVRKEKK